VLETKLLTGPSGYDVVVPSGALTYRLIQAGALRKLDKSKLGNLGNLDPQVMQLVEANDPGNDHALPYQRGTTSISYNPEMVEKVLGTRTIDSLASMPTATGRKTLRPRRHCSRACGRTFATSTHRNT
jgi:spermidine/putrescine-binding protein